MSQPRIRALPDVFTTRAARMLIRVDLPAPLGPSRPKIAPRGTVRFNDFNASFGEPSTPEYILRREETSMAGAFGWSMR